MKLVNELFMVSRVIISIIIQNVFDPSEHMSNYIGIQLRNIRYYGEIFPMGDSIGCASLFANQGD